MQGFRTRDKALVWELNHETVQIEPWGTDGLRVRATMEARIRDDLPGALLAPASTQAEIEISDRLATIRNGAVTATIQETEDVLHRRAVVRFSNSATGEELLGEAPSYFPRPPARDFRSVGDGLYHIEARFKAYEGERIYGLGQHQHGCLDQKGCVIDMQQVNTEVCIPFLLSSRGYGLLWHSPAIGRVELGRNATRWVAQAAPQLDYWITAGGTPAELMHRYADATGHPLMLPEWAAGFWQCKLRYQSQDELLEVAREYRRRGLPLSVIVVDYFHWTKQGDWRFDPEYWPDPAGMVRELEDMGIRVMVSIWPTVNPTSANFQEMEQRGLLARTKRGVPAHMGFREVDQEGRVYVHYYDATHPEAREFIWAQVRQGYYQHGVKVWWLDACEPEMLPMDPDNVLYHAGDGLALGNIYPQMHASAFYDGMRAEGEDEIVLLARSAWAGSQRYGAAVWSGDIQSTFEALRTQVPAGLNIGLSGIPWWTTDIGGFFGGDTSTPYFRELIVRWFQYGTFCPLFRLHGFRLPRADLTGSGAPNEAWSFGDEAYGIIRDLLLLRERLRPYIMAQMQLAQTAGAPPMRPIFFDFPADDVAWSISDQFMFGPDLLVAPVLHQGARNREVYLPAGATWTDAWTDDVHAGGTWIAAEAPLERIPLYLRDGKELPIRANVPDA
jgi:alpha-D-xyloside xylohydrolase